MIKFNFSLPRTVRVKLNSGCQYKCKFCHQEGSASTLDADPAELVKALRILKNSLGFYRVHFTGGEPTLYKKFSDLLKLTKRLGFINALTTNGQFQSKQLPSLKKAGLDSINFSLHTLDPYAFLNLQKINFDIKTGVRWAEDCMQRTIQNIISANKILKTKVNCVVSSDAISGQSVLEFCIQNNIELRFLNDLGLGDLANENIKKILEKNGAKLIGHEVTFLSSSHRLDYQIGSYKFGVKCIRRFFLNTLCGDCDLKDSAGCLEDFYGIRFEGRPLMVRLCLNKNNTPYVQKFNSFLESEQFKEVKKMIENLSEYIKKDSIIEEQKKKYKNEDFLEL